MIPTLENLYRKISFPLYLLSILAFAYFGFALAENETLKPMLGLLLGLAGMGLWRVFASPRSLRRLRGAAYVVFTTIFVILGVLAFLWTIRS